MTELNMKIVVVPAQAERAQIHPLRATVVDSFKTCPNWTQKANRLGHSSKPRS